MPKLFKFDLWTIFYAIELKYGQQFYFSKTYLLAPTTQQKFVQSQQKKHTHTHKKMCEIRSRCERRH